MINAAGLRAQLVEHSCVVGDRILIFFERFAVVPKLLTPGNLAALF